MSAYPPPTQILSLFNPLYFETSDVDITVGYLDTNYLKFPIAQGLENLQKTNITDATQSTSVSTGSLVTAGGVGIAKQTHIGGQLHCTSTATSTSTTTGCIRASGGVGIAENLNVGGTTTSTGLITATGGLTTGAGSVLTSTGTTTLTGATTANGLITANANLTLDGSQLLNFGTSRTAYITSGLNSAGSLDILNQITGATSRIRLGTNNSTSTGIAIDNTGMLTANNGLTMGGATNITLGSAVPTTAGQLGYVYSSPSYTTVAHNASGSAGTLLTFSNIPAGVYMFAGSISISTTAIASINYFNLFLRIDSTNVLASSAIPFPVTNLPASYTPNFSITGIINKVVAGTSINLYTTFNNASGTWNAIGTYGLLVRIG